MMQTSEEVKAIYNDFSKVISKCMEISYNSITELIQQCRKDFLLPHEQDHIDMFIPELYPFIHIYSPSSIPQGMI